MKEEKMKILFALLALFNMSSVSKTVVEQYCDCGCETTIEIYV